MIDIDGWKDGLLYRYQIKSNQITFLSHHHSTSALVSEILMSVLQTVQKTTDNLHMDRQCKKQQTIYIWTDSAKNNKQFTYGQTVQKTTNNLHMDRQCKKKKIYIWTDSAKKQQQFTYGQTVQKNNNNLHMDRQCKKQQTIYIWTDSAKNCTGAFTVLQTVQKKQQQFTYGQTVQKTTAIYIWTVHIYRLYRRQCAKYTYIYSVRLVYYRDILNYQRHIIHRMGTSTLCTVSIIM